MPHVMSVVAILCVIVSPMPALAQSPKTAQSAALATELGDLLSQRSLDAFASVDPESADRFVAALAYPKSQLLVVDAKYPVPVLLQQQIAAKRYRDVYLALQQAGVPEDKVFFLDIGFDGLQGKPEAVDVLYEGATKQVIFDGTPEKHKLTKPAYDQQLSAAENTYSRLLTVMIKQLKDQTIP